MYLYASPVYFDELDANGVLHNARYALHVEHAQSALFESFGQGWTSLGERDPDLRYAVRALNIEFLGPVTSPGVMDIRLYLTASVERVRPSASGASGGVRLVLWERARS